MQTLVHLAEATFPLKDQACHLKDLLTTTDLAAANGDLPEGHMLLELFTGLGFYWMMWFRSGQSSHLRVFQ